MISKSSGISKMLNKYRFSKYSAILFNNFFVSMEWILLVKLSVSVSPYQYQQLCTCMVANGTIGKSGIGTPSNSTCINLRKIVEINTYPLAT